MYLDRIYLESTGPIAKCDVELPFDEGKPIPVVIVGPNGSGKTIFLSYIVDALFEFAKQAFRDIVQPDNTGRTPYFRIIHPRAMRSGQPFSLSLLHFNSDDENLLYCEKSGTLDSTVYTNDLKSMFAPIWKWETDENFKEVYVKDHTVLLELQSGAHAFFPASRREDPY